MRELDSLELWIGTAKILAAAGYVVDEDVMVASDSDLLALPQFGRKKLAHVREVCGTTQNVEDADIEDIALDMVAAIDAMGDEIGALRLEVANLKGIIEQYNASLVRQADWFRSAVDIFSRLPEKMESKVLDAVNSKNVRGGLSMSIGSGLWET